jgi:predicted DNA binding CopG/RHH family protein
LQNRETAISDEMDNLGQISDKLQRYVDKVKLEVRMKATDATIRIADDEIARILQKLKREDQKQSQQIDRELK